MGKSGGIALVLPRSFAYFSIMGKVGRKTAD
jgi:hypothetical protein